MREYRESFNVEDIRGIAFKEVVPFFKGTYSLLDNELFLFFFVTLLMTTFFTGMVAFYVGQNNRRIRL